MDAVLIQLVLFSTLAVCVFKFRQLRRHVRLRARSRGRAAGMYLFFTTLPVGIYLLLFFGAVGLEEWAGVALISEAFARSLVLVVGIALLMALIANLSFITALSLIRRGEQE
jgi:hypothetical protein